jgi:3'-5' exonuclease
MLADVRTGDVLFLDIETVPFVPSFDDASPTMQDLWDSKSKQFRREEENAENVWQRAGIYAEFGKIICISVGIISGENPVKLRLKSFFGDDEKELLTQFSTMLSKFRPDHEINLCAHNGREFDFPYIARRMIVSGIKVPPILDNSGKKPWEVKLLDTMDLWKFGDYKHFTSLNLLTNILGIPTPKDDIEGSMVASVYWDENDLKRIVIYCEKDVVAVAQVFLALRVEPLIEPGNIESVTTFPGT